MTTHLKMCELFGDILLDGSAANRFRHEVVLPELTAGNVVVFDMVGVTNMTSSFANALIANLVHLNKDVFFKNVRFANCTPTVKVLIKLAIQFGESLSPHAIAA